MKKVILLSITLFTLQVFAQTPCENGLADGFPCENIDLMSHLVLGEAGTGGNYNDIWGWTDPVSGREFALLGRSDGTSFIEITNPLEPILIGNLWSHIVGESLWRDIKVFNNYAFIVSEQGGHGMQVFDLSQLTSVEVPPIEFEESAWYAGFGRAHNIAINEESGYAYGVGSDTFSGSLHIVDISNPLEPVLAGGYGESGYTHDAQIVNYKGPDENYADREVAFLCNGGSGVFIIDVDDKTDCQLISELPYPNVTYTHQGWLTEDHKYFVVNDEIDELSLDFNTRTHIFNVEDLDAPVYVGYHEHDTYASDHNLYTHNGLAYMSNYRAGLRIMDMNNLSAAELTELAYFDVDPGVESPGYSGTWSNYPYYGSGNVVISTFSDFFVVRPNESVVTSIEEKTQPVDLVVYPNPAINELTMGVQRHTQDLHFKIYDQAGRQVGHNILLPAGISTLTFPIDHLAQGSYRIVVSEQPQVSLQFVKL